MNFEEFGRLVVDEIEADDAVPVRVEVGTSLVEDLGLDSFEICRIVVVLEDLIDEEVPDELIPELRTIGDLYHHYTTRTAIHSA